MLEWINDNKEIVFSGLGTAIVVFLLGKIFVSKSVSSQKQSSGKESINIQAGGDVNIVDRKDS